MYVCVFCVSTSKYIFIRFLQVLKGVESISVLGSQLSTKPREQQPFSCFNITLYYYYYHYTFCSPYFYFDTYISHKFVNYFSYTSLLYILFDDGFFFVVFFVVASQFIPSFKLDYKYEHIKLFFFFILKNTQKNGTTKQTHNIWLCISICKFFFYFSFYQRNFFSYVVYTKKYFHAGV